MISNTVNCSSSATSASQASRGRSSSVPSAISLTSCSKSRSTDNRSFSRSACFTKPCTTQKHTLQHNTSAAVHDLEVSMDSSGESIDEQGFSHSLNLADIPLLPLEEILAPVQKDMAQMNANLLSIVGDRHPMLKAAAEQIFGAGGKKVRPMLVFLVARATCQASGMKDLTKEHRSLAEITEMIHTASLVHDDVLDECDLRRGSRTVNSKYGTRMAVLAGDYLFAQSSWFLANLNNLEVIKLISQVIADFANGEIAQAANLFDCDVTLETYMEKSFYKTASLIAASCRSAAVFSGMDEELKEDMFNYGKHLGLAFQVVDDILDFTQTEEQLGKPQGQDLAGGNLTCPIIYAMETNPELRDIIESEFQEEDSLEEALAMVNASGGIDKAMGLAKEEGQKALDSLQRLPEGAMRNSLAGMVAYVLQRIH